MPKKSQESVSAVATAVATAPKKNRSKQPVSTVEVKTVQSTSETKTERVKAPRRVHTLESVNAEFEALLKMIDDEVLRLKDVSGKNKGIRFLKSTRKRVSLICEHSKRISRRKQTEKRKNNNSGFLKPVEVSAELSDFVGWDHRQLHSRVEATKALCDYIKKNNLQKKDNRRCIIPDAKLGKLLSYTHSESEPLTYYTMQRHLTRHFPLKGSGAASTASAASAASAAQPSAVASTTVSASQPSSSAPKKNKK